MNERPKCKCGNEAFMFVDGKCVCGDCIMKNNSVEKIKIEEVFTNG